MGILTHSGNGHRTRPAPPAKPNASASRPSWCRWAGRCERARLRWILLRGLRTIIHFLWRPQRASENGSRNQQPEGSAGGWRLSLPESRNDGRSRAGRDDSARLVRWQCDESHAAGIQGRTLPGAGRKSLCACRCDVKGAQEIVKSLFGPLFWLPVALAIILAWLAGFTAGAAIGW